jgi:N-acetylglucosamine-6-phosphate deacetylase
MLGLQGIKGTLDAGADADLVVLSDSDSDSDTGAGIVTGGDGSGSGNGWRELVVEEVWKFGVRIFERGVDG